MWQQVIGVDISPHMQPLDIPDNLWLQVRIFLIQILIVTEAFGSVSNRTLSRPPIHYLLDRSLSQDTKAKHLRGQQTNIEWMLIF